MKKQELIRTDQRILRFWGVELYRASTKKDRDDEHWKVVRVFRGKNYWVVGIAHKTSYSLDERDLFAAFEARNKEEAVAIVNEAVPELIDDVAKVLHLSVSEEQLRKELERWKKRTPIKDRELLSLNGKDGSQIQNSP